MLLLAAAVWAGDGQSPIFRHQRLGRRGQPFSCLKFRTMVVGAEAALAAHLAASAEARVEWAATHKLTNDPRITALGKVLRKTSLDELPQLINVLRGEMSLVGPGRSSKPRSPATGRPSLPVLPCRLASPDCGKSPVALRQAIPSVSRSIWIMHRDGACAEISAFSCTPFPPYSLGEEAAEFSVECS